MGEIKVKILGLIPMREKKFQVNLIFLLKLGVKKIRDKFSIELFP